jgi:aarF domain-containing kinase
MQHRHLLSWTDQNFDILKDVLKAVRQHHVKMESDFINTVISLPLEGIGRQLDPKLDLSKSALTILRQLGLTLENLTNLPSRHFASLLKVSFVLGSMYPFAY